MSQDMDDIDIFLESIKIPDSEVVDTEWTPRRYVEAPPKSSLQAVSASLAWLLFIIASLFFLRSMPQTSWQALSAYTGSGTAGFWNEALLAQSAMFFFAGAFAGAAAVVIRFIKKAPAANPSAITLYSMSALSLIFAVLISVL